MAVWRRRKRQLGAYARVLQPFYVRSAHRHGAGRDRTGMLAVIQRFGSGVKLNVHFHTLVLDGVFTGRHPIPGTGPESARPRVPQPASGPFLPPIAAPHQEPPPPDP